MKMKCVIEDRSGQTWFGEVDLNWWQRKFPPRALRVKEARRGTRDIEGHNLVFFTTDKSEGARLIPGSWCNISIPEMYIVWKSFFQVRDDALDTGGRSSGRGGK